MFWYSIPTVMAQALMNALGTRLHKSTTRTPHLSAMKPKGIVTTKSVVQHHLGTLILLHKWGKLNIAYHTLQVLSP
jgi:hypothetical protein